MTFKVSSIIFLPCGTVKASLPYLIQKTTHVSHRVPLLMRKCMTKSLRMTTSTLSQVRSHQLTGLSNPWRSNSWQYVIWKKVMNSTLPGIMMTYMVFSVLTSSSYFVTSRRDPMQRAINHPHPLSLSIKAIKLLLHFLTS